MKFSSIIVGASAAVATAIPLEARQNGGDISQFNNFQLNSQPLQYIVAISGLDTQFQDIQGLIQNQGLNIDDLSNVFSDNTFDAQSLFSLGQLLLLQQLAEQQLFNGISLEQFQLPPPNFGLLANGLQGLDLDQVVTPDLQPQLAEVITENGK